MKAVQSHLFSIRGRMWALATILFVSTLTTTTTNAWTYLEIKTIYYEQVGMWSACVCEDTASLCIAEGGSQTNSYGHPGDVIRTVRAFSFLAIISMTVSVALLHYEMVGRAPLHLAMTFATVSLLVTVATFAAFFDQPMCNRKDTFSESFNIGVGLGCRIGETGAWLAMSLVACCVEVRHARALSVACFAVLATTIVTTALDPWIIDRVASIGLWNACACRATTSSEMRAVEAFSILSLVSLLFTMFANTQIGAGTIRGRVRIAAWAASAVCLAVSAVLFGVWKVSESDKLYLQWGFYLRCVEGVAACGGLIHCLWKGEDPVAVRSPHQEDSLFAVEQAARGMSNLS